MITEAIKEYIVHKLVSKLLGSIKLASNNLRHHLFVIVFCFCFTTIAIGLYDTFYAPRKIKKVLQEFIINNDRIDQNTTTGKRKLSFNTIVQNIKNSCIGNNRENCNIFGSSFQLHYSDKFITKDHAWCMVQQDNFNFYKKHDDIYFERVEMVADKKCREFIIKNGNCAESNLIELDEFAIHCPAIKSNCLDHSTNNVGSNTTPPSHILLVCLPDKLDYVYSNLHDCFAVIDGQHLKDYNTLNKNRGETKKLICEQLLNSAIN